MSSLSPVQRVRQRLGWPGVGAVASAGLALVVLAFSSRGVIEAVAVPSAKLVEEAEKDRQERAAQFAASLDQHVAHINGRSLFLVPGAPALPPPPAPVVEHVEPPPPLPPATYGGPSLVAMVNGTAWFSDGRRLEAGGEADEGLKVIELRPPWGAVVQWSGVEFTIGLFDRDSVVIGAPPASMQGPAAAKPESPENPPASPSEANAPASVPPVPAGDDPPLRGEAKIEPPRPIESR